LNLFVRRREELKLKKIKKQPDELIFNKEDTLSVINILSKLLRKIFYNKKITYNGFSELHEEYSLSIGLNKKEIYYDRNNLIEGMSNDNLTFRTFKIALEKMGYGITGLDVQLYNKSTGEKEIFGVRLNKDTEDK